MKSIGKSALTLLALALASTAAFADAGHAVPWQMTLQDSVTPVSDYIHWFHNWILFPLITIISLFVLGLLLTVIVKFNAKANPVPSKTTHHAGLKWRGR
jgi:cytochrome c oxidase subunit II